MIVAHAQVIINMEQGALPNTVRVTPQKKNSFSGPRVNAPITINPALISFAVSRMISPALLLPVFTRKSVFSL